MQDGKTALIKAANKGHEGIVEKLILHGVDVNVKDKVIYFLNIYTFTISIVCRYDVISYDMQ
jgi:ankyrin repeat protein